MREVTRDALLNEWAVIGDRILSAEEWEQIKQFFKAAKEYRSAPALWNRIDPFDAALKNLEPLLGRK